MRVQFTSEKLAGPEATTTFDAHLVAAYGDINVISEPVVNFLLLVISLYFALSFFFVVVRSRSFA